MRWIRMMLWIGFVMALQPCRAGEAVEQQQPTRWRGFNLQAKFNVGSSDRVFRESDFRLISDWGFNFVRLPMDYRCWIIDGDWERFNEAELKEIDDAVAMGRKYGLHVCLNFHRAPGYTVARPAEARDLWTDEEAQRVCLLHWETFAKRYKGIPAKELSFNLFNEPAEVAPELHNRVVRKLVAAIRAIDPDRPIMVDGRSYGREPWLELADLDVIQATRGYTPMNVSHYRAGWVTGSDQMPTPSWPQVRISGWLGGPHKVEPRGPLVVVGLNSGVNKVRVRVGTVSNRAKLQVRGDGALIAEKLFECGPGEGEWKRAVYSERYDIYQNVYDRDYTFQLAEGIERLELEVVDGDWLTLTELGLEVEGGESEAAIDLQGDYGIKPQPLQLVELADGGWGYLGGRLDDRDWLWGSMTPWFLLEARGGRVMVGEFGAYRETPHDVVLRWMEDMLANWKDAGWGWALWEFRGSFGVLDSGRKDVEYEDFQGHKLDRKMLELLQRY